MANPIIKISKQNLLQEYDLIKNNFSAIILTVNSNRAGIHTIYNILTAAVNKDLDDLKNLIEVDLYLSRINTYMEMAYLNDMEDHECKFSYITRVPGLLFKMQINKLHIMQSLILQSGTCHLFNFPKEITLLKQLKHLDLSGSHLDKIPKQIGLLENLQTLKLNTNKLSELPKEIGELRQLKTLEINENPMLRELPESIGNLRALEVLHANHDHLTHFPRNLNKLKALRELDFAYNLIQDIPPSVSTMPNLQTLRMDHNPLKADSRK